MQRTLFLVSLVLLFVGVAVCQQKKEAYVTVVLDKEYSLAARVMFQSLKETGTTREMVAVVASDLDVNTRTKIHNLGVRVVDLSTLGSSYISKGPLQHRFNKFLSKLLIWNMTEYDTIVYLNPDTLVFQNVDELFECGDFCAAFINPTTFNSGVMVLKPSRTVFIGMMEKLASGMDSYLQDQKFLNAYFPKLLEAPLFDGNLSRREDSSMKRLEGHYHTDHVLYYPHLSWGSSKPAVVEFLGLPTLKPWLWWSYMIMDLSWTWSAYRDRLPEAASDRGHHMVILRVLLGLAVLMLGAALTLFWYLRNTVSRHMCAFLSARGPVSVHSVTLVAGIVGLFTYAGCCLFSFIIIPVTSPASWAWAVFFLWMYATLFLVFGAFCCLLHLTGRYSNTTLDRPFAVPRAPFRSSLLLGLGLATYTVFHFLLLSNAGFTELFQKIVLFIFGIFVSIVLHFMVLSRIAFLWFTYGLAKGTHYSSASSFNLRPWAKAPTLLAVIAVNVLFLYMLVWALSGSYQDQSILTVPREQRKFVVISSDDWGRWTDATAIWPNMSYWQQFHEKGIPGSNNTMNGWTYATAETACDLREFFDFLEEMNMEATKFDHRVVITPFWTVGGPDVDAMKGLGCPDSPQCQYRELLGDHDSGLQREPFNRGDLKPVYMHGFKKRLWHPEYHCRSHFDHKKWINLMREKRDPATRACFDMGLVCATVGYDLRSENTMYDSEQEQLDWFSKGVDTFERIWGYRPRVHSSPHNITGKYLHSIVKQLDFLGVDNPIPGAPEDTVSTIDRARFDPFNLNFDYDKTWEVIVDQLATQSHLSLAFHAQNTFTEMYTPEQHKQLMETFKKTMKRLREYPGVVFVTSSELHQIRTKGWSQEVWSESFVFRNYSPQVVTLKVKNLKSVFYYGQDWSGRSLELLQMNGPENERERERTEVGATIRLLPNTVYELRLEEQ